ncbi:hypothetical protein C5167_004121 [Papaver somniferum]|nr:hypothetical protein C5167_004121 [Papaver somniferum]
MEVLVQTNEPISFGVNYKPCRRVMNVMSIGKEIDEILLVYQPEEKKQIITIPKARSTSGQSPVLQRK